jgi:hypothetical protein
LNNKGTRKLENSNKHIDNWLSQQFEDFTPNPDPAMWQSIDSALDRKERRSKFIWYWLAAGVLLIVVAGVSLQWNSKQHKTSSQSVAKQVESSAAESPSQSPMSQNAVSENANAQNADSKITTEQNATELNATTQNTAAQTAFVKSKVKRTAQGQSPIAPELSPTVSPVQLARVSSSLGDKDFDLLQNDLREKDFSDLNGLGLAMVKIEPSDNSESEASLNANQQTLKPLNWFEPRKMPEVLGRWSMELGVDANQTGLMYRANADYQQYVHKNYFDRMKSGEFALSASRIQGALMYQLSKNHSVKVGLAYAENRTQQKFDFRDSMPATVMQGQTADALGYYPIFGYLGLGPQVKFNSQSTYTMLSIPMGYTGHFAWRKDLYITPEVLVSANRLGVSAGAQTLDYQTLLQKAQVQDQFRTWVVGARFALGVEKRLNYSQAIGLRLNAQSMLSPMYLPKTALESRGWSAGLSAHYSWRIQ